MLIWSFAFIPGYQRREHGRAIGPTRAEHEILAGQRFGSINDRISQGVLLDLAERRIGPLQRSPIGKLHDGNVITLVFFGQKSGWEDPEEND